MISLTPRPVLAALVASSALAPLLELLLLVLVPPLLEEGDTYGGGEELRSHSEEGSWRRYDAGTPTRSNDSKDNSRIRLSDINKLSVFQGMMREFQVLTDKDATLAQGFVGNELDKDGIATGRLKLLTQDEYATALISPHDDKLAKFHQMEDQISAINKVVADKISKINLQATYDKSKITTEHEEALAAQLFAHATSVALEASMAVKP
ncbi:hypothetical protein T492DRAFT_895300, partial [Pavlovales sp. CCMP2436]